MSRDHRQAPMITILRHMHSECALKKQNIQIWPEPVSGHVTLFYEITTLMSLKSSIMSKLDQEFEKKVASSFCKVLANLTG